LAYRLVLTRAARKDLDRLPKEVLERADATILALADQPRPFGSEKLQGFENLYRIRVGKHRIIYEIDRAASVVASSRRATSFPLAALRLSSQRPRRTRVKPFLARRGPP
jgi:mRNA interferase RelE/StbE